MQLSRYGASLAAITLAALSGCRSISEPSISENPTASTGIGGYHACGLQEDGRAFCWGANFYGQLGDGTGEPTATPVPVAGSYRFSKLSAHAHNSCGVSEGTIYCWGLGSDGQIGDGGTTGTAVPVAASASGLTFKTVSVGGYHACGLTADGAAYCWGSNSAGQVGDGTQQSRLIPSAVAGNLRFAMLSSGSLHTCGVTTASKAYCWGSNFEGQIGDNSLVSRAAPAMVAGGHRLTAISAGNRHSCALNSAGKMFCWGQNEFGQLGDGTTTERQSPVAVSGNLTFDFVAGRGGYQSCGITTDSRAYCWGENAQGQLGDGTTERRLVPTAVSGGLRFQFIDTGAEATCGVTEGGETYCWGENDDGELGIGSNTNRSVPVRVVLPTE